MDPLFLSDRLQPGSREKSSLCIISSESTSWRGKQRCRWEKKRSILLSCNKQRKIKQIEKVAQLNHTVFWLWPNFKIIRTGKNLMFIHFQSTWPVRKKPHLLNCLVPVFHLSHNFNDFSASPNYIIINMLHFLYLQTNIRNKYSKIKTALTMPQVCKLCFNSVVSVFLSGDFIHTC